MEDANTTTWKTTLSESELNNVIKNAKFVKLDKKSSYIQLKDYAL